MMKNIDFILFVILLIIEIPFRFAGMLCAMAAHGFCDGYKNSMAQLRKEFKEDQMRENMGMFRGKRVDNGKWCKGYLVKTHNGVYYIGYLHENTAFNGDEVDPATVGECTGKTDKNGKEIYRGDIVKAYHNLDERYDTGIIDYFDMIYQLKRIKEEVWDTHFRYWKDGVNEWYSMEQYFSEDLEIIGNIHDNQKLLEEKQND